MKSLETKEPFFALTPLRRAADANAGPAADSTSFSEETIPSSYSAPAYEPRQLPLMVSEAEAEALMHVLLLAPMEGGAFGSAMERILSRLADIQRSFGRDENP